jgi:cob(I)alamin adenosyltransferase
MGHERPMTTRIYTKTGDGGDTGLWGGERVPKDHVRVEAYGTVDELGAALGQAQVLAPPPELAALLAELQALLFELGAELATPPSKGQLPAGIDEADVTRLERAIDEHEASLPPLKSFILPGGTPLAAALHVARAVCRRAERRVVTLREAEPVTRQTTVVFLNRLGDLLFVLARRANHLAGTADVAWHRRVTKAT